MVSTVDLKVSEYIKWHRGEIEVYVQIRHIMS